MLVWELLYCYGRYGLCCLPHWLSIERSVASLHPAVTPCKSCCLGNVRKREPAGASTGVQQTWSDASCRFQSLSGWCMTEEVVGDRWKEILLWFSQKQFSKSVFLNFSISFVWCPLEKLLFKENLHFPWEENVCVCSLLSTVGLGGGEMLPHQS